MYREVVGDLDARAVARASDRGSTSARHPPRPFRRRAARDRDHSSQLERRLRAADRAIAMPSPTAASRSERRPVGADLVLRVARLPGRGPAGGSPAAGSSAASEVATQVRELPMASASDATRSVRPRRRRTADSGDDRDLALVVRRRCGVVGEPRSVDRRMPAGTDGESTAPSRRRVSRPLGDDPPRRSPAAQRRSRGRRVGGERDARPRDEGWSARRPAVIVAGTRMLAGRRG